MPAAPAGRTTTDPAGRTRGALLLLALLLVAPLLLSWPGPLVWRSAVLAAPDQEAAPHIWGLWAAWTERAPLIVETKLLGWPDGVRLVLVDAANLPAFVLGYLIGGPASGYNLTFCAGLALAGLAGALLAKEVGGDQILGALTGLCCPTLLANAADGQTEGFAVGWVGVQLAMLLRLRRGWAAAPALGLCLAMAWYSGPYNGIFAVGIDVVVGLALLAALRADRPQLRQLAGRLAAGAGLATLLVAPLLTAVISLRGAGLPGSAERAGLPEIVENPAIFRGGVRTGADLLDPWLPGFLTGGEADISHTAYLGIVALILAVLVVRRDRRRWPWLVGAIGMALFSLGPWLYLGGRALRVGGLVPGPAGLLVMLLPPLGRLTRWYRAGAVATLLLAPLVSLSARSLRARALVGAAVLLDALFLAPLAWPLHSASLPDVSAYAALPPGAAVLELPRRSSAQPPPGVWRDLGALAQTQHGHPLVGTIMGLTEPAAAPGWQHIVQDLMRTGSARSEDLRRLEQGVGAVSLLLQLQPVPDSARDNLDRCLGPLVGESTDILIYQTNSSGPGRDAGGGCAPDRARSEPR